MSDNLSEFGKRLISLMMIDEKKKAFAKRVGVLPHQLSRYFNGKSYPSLETMRKIALATGCNLHWLETGEGDAYFTNPTDMDKEMWDEAEKTAAVKKPGPPFDPGQVRMLGAKTTSKVTDPARLHLARSWILSMTELDKESREIVVELLNDLVRDPDLRLILYEHHQFLKFQKKKK